MDVSGPNIPADLREDLRRLAKRHGAAALVAGLAEFVKHFAVAGVAAEIERKRAGDTAAEQCPRCRRNAAVIQATKDQLKPPRTSDDDGAKKIRDAASD